MKQIFGWFCEDIRGERIKPRERQTVLIGSPGVGKSVLFFLAALYQAQSSYTIYYRRTTRENDISIFLMMPYQNNNVRVWFTRSLSKLQLQGGLTKIHLLLFGFQQDCRSELHDRNIYTFVDGPRHSDRLNTLQDTYDYFCTSGGHPVPKQEQEAIFRTWVLGGWTEKEAIEGLQAFSPYHEQTARHAYELCGGSIRNLLQVCQSDQQYAIVKKNTDRLLSWHNKDAVKVALTSTEISENEKSFDRVRTMFRQEKEDDALQIVDSVYILHELRRRIDLSIWFDGYRLSLSVLDGILQGLYFEKCIHKWFDEQKPKPIENVCWSTGTTIDGLSPFQAPNVYWIPSVSNFPNIDSAVVVNDQLYALQMTCTKSKNHRFDANEFLETFVQLVRVSFPTLKENVNIIFLVPGNFILSLPPAPDHDNLTFTLQYVDMTRGEFFDRSMRLLPFLGP